jgi:hypothetical protein
MKIKPADIECQGYSSYVIFNIQGKDSTVINLMILSSGLICNVSKSSKWFNNEHTWKIETDHPKLHGSNSSSASIQLAK